MIRGITRRVAALGLGWLLAAGAFAQEAPGSFTPLLLDGQTSLEVDATPGLELGADSTIEFLVEAAWEDEDGIVAYPAVLGRREPYAGDDPAGFAAATQYSVHIAPDRQAIGLFDGTRFASVPFDFSDGKLHHVALVTAGGRTTVYVDREVRGTLDFGPSATPGLPLHVGSSDGGSELFMGAIPSVRLWRSALTADEVAAIADLLGEPGEGDPDPAELAAFSDFTGAEPQLVVLEEPAAAESAPLPRLPARTQPAEAGGDVETRGLGDKIKQKVQSSKQKRIEESIEETEALKRGREGERQRVLARLAKYQNAEVTQESVVLGPNLKLRRPKTQVGGQTLSASEERSKRRLERRLAKLDRTIEDYTIALGGAPDYAGGLARRPGRASGAEPPELAAADAPPNRPPPRRPRADTDADTEQPEEIDLDALANRPALPQRRARAEALAPPLDLLPPVRQSAVATRLTASALASAPRAARGPLREYFAAAEEPLAPGYEERLAQFQKLDALLAAAQRQKGEIGAAATAEQRLLQDTVRDAALMKSANVASPTHALELKRLGLQPSPAARIGAFTDARLDGEMTKLGSGSFNTVYRGKYKQPDGQIVEGIFKPEVRQGTRLPAAAEESGIDADEPRAGYRTLATTRLDQVLGFGNLTTRAEMAVHDETLGTVSQRAQGVSLLGRRVLTNKRVPDDALQGVLDMGLDEYNKDAESKIGVKRVNDRDEYYYEDVGAHEINFADPRLRRDLVRLQLMDAIAGQVDRHPGNYFVHQDADGACVGVQGIDNDVSWGKRLERASGSDLHASFHLPRHLPPYVDREAFDAVMELTPSKLAENMGGLLTRAEMDAATKRLDEVQTHLRGLQRSGKVLNSLMSWAGSDVTTALTTPVGRDRMGTVEYNSYIGRDFNYQSKMRDLDAVLPYPENAQAKLAP